MKHKQELIGKLLVLGPLALVKCMNTQRLYHARDICLERQLKEHPEAKPLGYYQDPLYVIPDIVTTDGNGFRKAIWHGSDGLTYVVAANQCYDAETLRQIVG